MKAQKARSGPLVCPGSPNLKPSVAFPPSWDQEILPFILISQLQILWVHGRQIRYVRILTYLWVHVVMMEQDPIGEAENLWGYIKGPSFFLYRFGSIVHPCASIEGYDRLSFNTTNFLYTYTNNHLSLLSCPTYMDVRSAICRDAGTMDYRTLIATERGLRAAGRWQMKTHLLMQFSLAVERLSWNSRSSYKLNASSSNSRLSFILRSPSPQVKTPAA